jgi:hypothetical protein
MNEILSGEIHADLVLLRTPTTLRIPGMSETRIADYERIRASGP